VLTEYLRHYNTGRPHRALGQLAPAQLTPRHPSRSTSPSTGSAENQSSADSYTSTRSPHDRPTLLHEHAGHHPYRVFEPDRVTPCQPSGPWRADQWGDAGLSGDRLDRGCDVPAFQEQPQRCIDDALAAARSARGDSRRAGP
jgi:hypothetical protein